MMNILMYDEYTYDVSNVLVCYADRSTFHIIIH